MKILVCGGRDFGYEEKERHYIFKVLGAFTQPFSDQTDDPDTWLPRKGTHIIAGGAKGVDELAIDWAVVNWTEFTEVKADWEKYGKGAGHLRNTEMLKLEPDFVIAFPGGVGTENMVMQAKKAGVPVLRADYDSPH